MSRNPFKGVQKGGKVQPAGMMQLPTMPDFSDPLMQANPMARAMPMLSGPATGGGAGTPTPTAQPQSQPSYTPPVPGAPVQTASVNPVQAIPEAPMAAPQDPTGALGDRFSAVQEGISSGAMDPTGANYTTFAPGLVGTGPTPIHRFLDASAKSAGVPFDFSDQAGGFMQNLIDHGPKLDPKVLETVPPSSNIEDRRDEKWYGNTDIRQWDPTMWKEYQQDLDKDNGLPSTPPLRS